MSTLRMARATDPQTSHAAAQRVLESGRWRSQRDAFTLLVRSLPGLTSAELARASGRWDRYVAARRLPELEADGVIRRGDARKCTAHGTDAVTWWPVEGQQELPL